MITLTSNRAKWVERANDTASVFRRVDVQSEIKRDLARQVRRMNKAQIKGRGIGASGPFAPLAASTVKRKGHDKPLIDTGKLFGQATRGGSVKAGYVPAFKAFTFSYTINHPAIQFLQKGTRNMPARPVVDPNEKQQKQLVDGIVDAVIRAWRKIGWFDRIVDNKLHGFDNISLN